MEISLADVIKVIRKFKNEIEFSRAVFMLEMTFFMDGPKKAMHHARQIAAAYQNIRVAREMKASY